MESYTSFVVPQMNAARTGISEHTRSTQSSCLIAFSPLKQEGFINLLSRGGF